MWPLNVNEMIYCGPATTKKLARFGVVSIGQLAQLDPSFLKLLLGVNGVALWQYANGLDQSRVMHRDVVSPVKSIGHGITCITNLENEEEVWRVMLSLCQDIGHRLQCHELTARGVQIAIRGDDLFGSQFQCKLPISTQLPSEIAAAAFRLFKDKYQWYHKVRAVTVRAIDLAPKNDVSDQLSIFIDTAKLQVRERLEDAIEEIRERFGKQAITYATLLGDIKMPEDGREKVRMPGIMYQ